MGIRASSSSSSLDACKHSSVKAACCFVFSEALQWTVVLCVFLNKLVILISEIVG
jgi:hypothetical protein